MPVATLYSYENMFNAALNQSKQDIYYKKETLINCIVVGEHYSAVSVTRVSPFKHIVCYFFVNSPQILNSNFKQPCCLSKTLKRH